MWLRTGSDRSKRTGPYVEILAEASTAAYGVLSCEHSDFGRCGSAILGFSTPRLRSWISDLGFLTTIADIELNSSDFSIRSLVLKSFSVNFQSAFRIPHSTIVDPVAHPSSRSRDSN